MAGRGGQSAASADAAGPVVICCAVDDESTISAVARELEQDGHSVEIVSGADTEPERLGAAIDHCHGEGLYVLCRSRALGRDAVDALREILLAKHVPFGRTLTVASTRQRELRERIVASLKRVTAGRVQRMSTVPPEGRKPRPRAKPTQLGIPAQAPTPAARNPPADVSRPRPRRHATQLGMSIPPPANKAPAAVNKPSATVHRTVVHQGLAEDPPAAGEPDLQRLRESGPVDIADGAAENPVEEEAITNAQMPAITGPVPPPDKAEAAPPSSTPTAPGGESATPAAAGALPSSTPTAPATEGPASPPPIATAPPPISRTRPISARPVLGDAAIHQRVERATPEVRRHAAKAAEESVARAKVIDPDELADLDATDPARDLRGTGLLDEKIQDVPVRSGNTSVSPVVPVTPPPPVRSGNTVVVHESLIDGNPLKLAELSAAVIDTVGPSDGPSLPEGRTLGDLGDLGDLGGASLQAMPAPSLPMGLVASPEPEPAPSAERPRWLVPAGLAIGAALIGGMITAVVAGGDDEPETGDGKLAEADTKEPATPTPGKGGNDETPDKVVAVADERTIVGQALRNRKLKALDVLLVAPEAFGPSDLAAAEAHCAELEIEGLSGWRMAELGEVMSLSEAGMVGRGYYWSATAADTFGDAQLGWYGRRRRVVTRTQDSLAVCVRRSGE